MRLLRKTLAILVSLAIATVPAQAAAGAVEVTFVAPATYADAGGDRAQVQANEATLLHFLQGLGVRHLGSDQVLRIDVLDIDLAGTVRPSRRGRGELRIARGGADAPHIRLHYALSAGGSLVASGEETLTDLDYLRRLDYAIDDPLRHEKRLLGRWFRERFVALKGG